MCSTFKRDPKTARLGHEILPFQMGYLPEFYQKKAEVELGDTPESRQKGLKILKDMIENDVNFVGVTFDDNYLLQYLRCRKFDAASALSQLKRFVNLRKKRGDLFRNFNFDKMAVCTRNKIVTFLPYRCQDGCVIGVIQLDNWIPEEFPVEEVRRMVLLFLCQSLRDIMTQVNGFKAIVDFRCSSIRHIRYFTPTNIYLIYHGIMECSSGRYKEIHFVNQSLTFKAFWILMKPFFTAKMKSRLHFHSSPEALLDFFPAACLPVQYGGVLEDYDMTGWLRDVMTPEMMATIGGGAYPGKMTNY